MSSMDRAVMAIVPATIATVVFAFGGGFRGRYEFDGSDDDAFDEHRSVSMMLIFEEYEGLAGC